jgi:hypothetical protein
VPQEFDQSSVLEPLVESLEPSEDKSEEVGLEESERPLEIELRRFDSQPGIINPFVEYGKSIICPTAWTLKRAI